MFLDAAMYMNMALTLGIQMSLSRKLHLSSGPDGRSGPSLPEECLLAKKNQAYMIVTDTIKLSLIAGRNTLTLAEDRRIAKELAYYQPV